MRRKGRNLSGTRADHILRLLGWDRSEFVRRFNRATGHRIAAAEAWRWFNERGLSGEASLFLRYQVRIAQLERRSARAREQAAAAARAPLLSGPDISALRDFAGLLGRLADQLEAPAGRRTKSVRGRGETVEQ